MQNKFVISLLLGITSSVKLGDITELHNPEGRKHKMPNLWSKAYNDTWKYMHPYYKSVNHEDYPNDSPDGYRYPINVEMDPHFWQWGFHGNNHYWGGMGDPRRIAASPFYEAQNTTAASNPTVDPNAGVLVQTSEPAPASGGALTPQ